MERSAVYTLALLTLAGFTYARPESISAPCSPSPCGPNSSCRKLGDSPVCSCKAGYIGQPPTCRLDCMHSHECSADRACVNTTCVDPCVDACGVNAECRVKNHIAECSCKVGYSGDPFSSCSPDIFPLCLPSPCGPNANCREVNNKVVCSCIPGFIGLPPNCRPECTYSNECGADRACVNTTCVDPCVDACGVNAECRVKNHIAECSCKVGYSGDPLTSCSPDEVVADILVLCSSSPCGPNANCREVNSTAVCSCVQGFIGQPPNCHPECTNNNDDCGADRACVNKTCVDPCVDACGVNAECRVNNHIPVCSCKYGYSGNPFTSCLPDKVLADTFPPCSPSPCGPNANCREVNNKAVCSCVPGFIGLPPNCRQECTNSDDCGVNSTCVNTTCVDPCVDACGVNAECRVNNHNAICSCPFGYSGDPFISCSPEVVADIISPLCSPSPCGPNANCRELGNYPACVCVEGFIGLPPNCRPCTNSNECGADRACVNTTCVDPCVDSCGVNTVCNVDKHIAVCRCKAGYSGDPFKSCSPDEVVADIFPACSPSPCGSNANCREVNSTAVCSCVPGFIGQPPNCHPECTNSNECSDNKACVKSTCVDPCVDVCGAKTDCTVMKHIPVCSCKSGYTGNPFVGCTSIYMP